MPAHFASQALPYVFPSQPQTGSYSLVHMQSSTGVPLQLIVFLVQDENKPTIRKIITKKFFITAAYYFLAIEHFIKFNVAGGNGDYKLIKVFHDLQEFFYFHILTPLPLTNNRFVYSRQ